MGDLTKRMSGKAVSFFKREYCTDLCFSYSERGCCYGSAYDWSGITEPTNIGDLCIHPEHLRDKCFVVSIGDFFGVLDSNEERTGKNK